MVAGSLPTVGGPESYSGAVLIRHADATRDAEACAAIYAPFVRDTAASFEVLPPSPREFGERIERIALRHPWLVAVQDEEVIGYAYASPHRERAAYRWAADVTVYVSGSRHRRGAGRALYGELLTLLKRQGMHVACAGITLPNDASVALHAGFGFTQVGTYRRIGWKAGVWHDVTWWQLQLVEPGDESPAEPKPPARLAT